MPKRSFFGHSLALVTVIIWGATFISTKVLLGAVSPVAILFYRFAIAYPLLWLIHPKVYSWNGWREELQLAGMGLTGVSLYFLAENIALQYTQAANVSLLVTTAPILTAIVAHLFTSDEKLSRNLVAGFLLAFTGVFLVAFNGQFVLKISPIGDLLSLLAALVWAVYSILLKRMDPSRHPVYLVRKTFFYGLLTTIPCLFWFQTDLKITPLLDLTMLLNLLFLGVIASALCYVMWNLAVREIGVIKTSNYIYLIPLITILSSWLFLQERITGLMLIGGVLILGGVHISERGLRLPGLGK